MSTQPTSETIAPRTGDIWKEGDPRFSRHILVLRADGADATIQSAYRTPETIGWQTFGPKRRARIERFNGKRGGYSLVIRSTQSTP